MKPLHESSPPEYICIIYICGKLVAMCICGFVDFDHTPAQFRIRVRLLMCYQLLNMFDFNLISQGVSEHME